MNLLVISNQILLVIAIGLTADSKTIRKMELKDNDQYSSTIQRPNSKQTSPNCTATDNVEEMIPRLVNLLHEFSKNLKIGYLGLCFNNPRFENGKFTLTKFFTLVFILYWDCDVSCYCNDPINNKLQRLWEIDHFSYLYSSKLRNFGWWETFEVLCCNQFNI